MKVIADFTVIPMGTGVSVSEHIAACQRELEKADVVFQLHANGTNVEGEWDAVFGAIRRCHEVVHAMDVPRVMTTVTLGTRTDRDQTMDDKTASVERRLKDPL